MYTCLKDKVVIMSIFLTNLQYKGRYKLGHYCYLSAKKKKKKKKKGTTEVVHPSAHQNIGIKIRHIILKKVIMLNLKK